MSNHEVLIVDPEQDEVQRITDYLKDLGYSALWAKDLPDAEAVLRSRPVAAIICDHSLPSGKGTDLLRSVRETEKTKNLPVLMMTSVASTKVVHEAREFGVSDFILKPLDVQRLRKVLAQFVSKNHV